MIRKDNVLQDLNTCESPSKAVQGAAKEPENWQLGGTDSPKEAIANKHQAHPVDPGKLK